MGSFIHPSWMEEGRHQGMFPKFYKYIIQVCLVNIEVLHSNLKGKFLKKSSYEALWRFGPLSREVWMYIEVILSS